MDIPAIDPRLIDQELVSAGSGAGRRHTGPMRIIFMGTPQFALGPLKALLRTDALEVVAVVTRPDTVSSRGNKTTPSPVKQLAVEHGLPVIETKTVRTPEIQARLASFEPDIIAVAAYGALLPDEVLTMAPFGCINVHASLLPRWRGAAPIQRALLEGDPMVGFSIMKIGREMDAGPWCVQEGFAPGEHVFDEVASRLSATGGNALAEVLASWWKGAGPVWNVQDPDLVTFAPKISKAELMLQPADPAARNARRVFASSDAAPARCVIAGRPVRVTRAHILDPEELQDLTSGAFGIPALDCQPGKVLLQHKRLFLGCADGVFEVLALRPDGKREMAASDFIAGIQNKKDEGWQAL